MCSLGQHVHSLLPHAAAHVAASTRDQPHQSCHSNRCQALVRPPVYTIPGVSWLLLEAMNYNDGFEKVHTSNISGGNGGKDAVRHLVLSRVVDAPVVDA